MAGTTINIKSVMASGIGSQISEEVAAQITALVVDAEALRTGLAALAAAQNLVNAKLDADAGVTDADYAATHDVVVTTYDAAGDMTAAKIE